MEMHHSVIFLSSGSIRAPQYSFRNRVEERDQHEQHVSSRSGPSRKDPRGDIRHHDQDICARDDNEIDAQPRPVRTVRCAGKSEDSAYDDAEDLKRYVYGRQFGSFPG